MSSHAPHHDLRRSLRAPPWAVVALAAGGLGCSAAHYARSADRDVLAVLDRRQDAVQRARMETVRFPAELPPAPAADVPLQPGAGGAAPAGAQAGPPPDEEPARDELELTLRDCLRIATDGNRDYITEREGLYLSAIALVDQRHIFSTRLSAALSYVLADGDDSARTHSAALSAAATRTLHFGGDLTLSADSSFVTSQNALPIFGEGTIDNPVEIIGTTKDDFASGVNLNLRQPLLRGGGHTVAFEPLTQAERNLLYAVREFELFRQDFAVDVASRFYDLVQRNRSIANTRGNFEGFVFARKQAEALFQVGRRPALDVLRAKRGELNARNDLIEAEESYQLALDNFKVFLGVPVSREIAILPDEPEFVPVRYDLASALEVAEANRLDLMNSEGRLRDAERRVRIAADGLQPDLDLNLNAGLDTGFAVPTFEEQELERESYRLSLDFQVPVYRVLEGNAYRAAQIALERQRRAFEVFRENLRIGIRGAFRELERRKASLEIQKQLIADQRKNVTIAELRFARGEIPNRDLVEARQSLLEARNGLISEQVSYEIARLQLLRDLGILFVDEEGIFRQ